MGKRIHALDSLRGLASLQVVLGHFLVAIPAYVWIVYFKADTPHDSWFYFFHSPIHFFVSASPAVIIFFVLSGYVLSLPYFGEGKKNLSYLNFFIKRILRLYLPCIAAVLLSILLRELFYNKEALSGFDTWVKLMWSKENKDINWINIFTLNTNEIDYYIPSAWTLPIEIKLSLILPLYVAVLKRLNFLYSILSVLILLVLFTLIGKTGIKTIFPDFALTYYMTFFLMGSVLCKYRALVLNFINKLNTVTYICLLFIALNIFTIDYNNWLVPVSILSIENKIEQYIIGCTAIFFIVIVLSKKAARVMNHGPLIFLGKISFSLYLIHQLVLVMVILTLHTYISSGLVLLAIAFPLSLIIALLFYNCIERPSIYISHWVSGKTKFAIKEKFVLK